MTLADVLAVATGLAIIGTGFASLTLVLALLVPRRVERAGERIEERPAGMCLRGVALFLLVLLSAGALLKAPGAPFHLLAIALIVTGLTLAAFGGAGLAARLGRRWGAARGGGGSLSDILRGALLLEGAALLPIVGWFVVAPIAFFASLGAGISSLRRPRAAAAVPAPQV
jgi:hypothetical protein